MVSAEAFNFYVKRCLCCEENLIRKQTIWTNFLSTSDAGRHASWIGMKAGLHAGCSCSLVNAMIVLKNHKTLVVVVRGFG